MHFLRFERERLENIKLHNTKRKKNFFNAFEGKYSAYIFYPHKLISTYEIKLSIFLLVHF